jgi:hypothetical protein
MSNQIAGEGAGGPRVSGLGASADVIIPEVSEMRDAQSTPKCHGATSTMPARRRRSKKAPVPLQ